MTAAAGRGVKRRCDTCDAPFYDMLRKPIRCPRCGAEHDAKAGKKKLASVPRSPKSRLVRGGRTAPRPAPEQTESAVREEGNPAPLTGTDADGMEESD